MTSLTTTWPRHLVRTRIEEVFRKHAVSVAGSPWTFVVDSRNVVEELLTTLNDMELLDE